MAVAPKTTTAPTGSIPPFGLRMLPELRERIEEAARSAGRSMNAEIVARLEQSFATTGTDVDWAKRLELRANELRLDTVRTHLFSAQQVAAQLAEEARALKARNAAKETQLMHQVRGAAVAQEVQRLNSLHAALLEENVRLARAVDDEYRPINERLDSAADEINQPHYTALAASEDALGVPAAKRVIVRRAK